VVGAEGPVAARGRNYRSFVNNRRTEPSGTAISTRSRRDDANHELCPDFDADRAVVGDGIDHGVLHCVEPRATARGAGATS
jgi:hypothetical protein